MIIIRNSAFKVKAETVQSHEGIMPEKGALLFCEENSCLVYGDGFNWLRLGPESAVKSALALALNTPQIEPCVGGVEEQAVFYDTVVYNLGTAFTPAGGNQITMNKDMVYDFSADILVSADVSNVDYILHTYLNAVKVDTRTTNLGNKDEHYHLSGFASEGGFGKVRNINMYDALEQDYDLNPKIEKHLWDFCELVKTAYVLKETAEVLGRGGSHYTKNPCASVIKNPDEVKRINEVVLPSIFEQLNLIFEGNF